MSEPAKEQIEKAGAEFRTAVDASMAEHEAHDGCAGCAAAAERLAVASERLAALAPPAQTQRPDLVRLAHLYEHSDPDCEIPGCTCCPALIDLLGKVAAQTQQGLSGEEGPLCMAVTRNGHRCSLAPHEELDDNHEAEGAADNGGTLLWTENYPLEKQPRPAAALRTSAPATLAGEPVGCGAIEDARVAGIREAADFCATNKNLKGLALAIELRVLSLKQPRPSPAAAPAQLSEVQEALEAACGFVFDLTENYSEKYSALQVRGKRLHAKLQAALAGQPAPTEDREALRAAALEVPPWVANLIEGVRDVLAEAGNGILTEDGKGIVEYLCGDCARNQKTGAHEEGCIWGMLSASLDEAETARDLALAGSPAQRGQLGKKGDES